MKTETERKRALIGEIMLVVRANNTPKADEILLALAFRTEFELRQIARELNIHPLRLVGEVQPEPQPRRTTPAQVPVSMFPYECPRCGHLYATAQAERHNAIGSVECPGGLLNELRRRP